MLSEVKIKSLLVAAIDFNSGIMCLLSKVVAIGERADKRTIRSINESIELLTSDYLKRLKNINEGSI